MEIVVNEFRVAPFNELCWDVQEWKGAKPHHANGGLGGEPKWWSCGRYPSDLYDALEEIARAMRIAKRQSAALKRALPEAQRIERQLELAARDVPTKKGSSVEFCGYRIVCKGDLCWELHEWKAAAAHRSNGGVPGEPKWWSCGRYPSTLSQALCDVYELLIKREEGEFDVESAMKRAAEIKEGLLEAASPFLSKRQKGEKSK